MRDSIAIVDGSDLTEIATHLHYEGDIVTEDVQEEDVEELKRNLRNKKISGYRGFSSTADQRCAAIVRRLAAPVGLNATLLLKGGAVGKVLLTYDDDDCLRVEGERVLGLKLPAKSLSAVCRGTDGMLALRSSYSPEDLQRAVSLVFRRSTAGALAAEVPESFSVSGELPVRVSDELNVEIDLMFAEAADAEDFTRLLEMLARDVALAEIAARPVTYFPPEGVPSAAKLSQKIRFRELQLHRTRIQEHDSEAAKREIRRINNARREELAEQGYAELNDEFRDVLRMLQAGVPFVTHHFNGIATSLVYSKITAGTLRYGRDRLVHILRDNSADDGGVEAMCIAGNGLFELLTSKCRAPDDPDIDECYAVSDLHSVGRGVPVPTLPLLRHVPEELLKQSVSLLCKDAQVRLTFESEEVAQKVARFFRTIIWHQEQDYLDTSRVLLLDFSDEMTHSRAGIAKGKSFNAPVG